KEERADGHGHDGEEVDRGGHAPLAPLSGASGERGLPFLTKAMAANVASSASVSATSAVAPAPAAVPSSSQPAMPPVPRSSAAITRPALPGPRSTRIIPSATMARTTPDAASRNSVITRRSAQRAVQHRLLRGELCDHRLLHVQTVVEQRTAVLAGGNAARQQARQGGEHVAHRAPREAHRRSPQAGPHRPTTHERGPGAAPTAGHARAGQ